MAIQPYRYEGGLLTLGDEVVMLLFFPDKPDMPWLKCKPLHNFLGAKNISQTLARVHGEDKMSLRALVQSKGAPARLVPMNATLPNHEDYHEGKTIYINESGLYAVALKSSKPEAAAFQRWVTTEVLPSIRRTGAYAQGPNAATSAQLAKTCADVLTDAVPGILQKVTAHIDQRLAHLETRQRVNLGVRAPSRPAPHNPPPIARCIEGAGRPLPVAKDTFF